MIIVRQFVSGDQGEVKTLGAINAAPKKRNVETTLFRNMCISDLWGKRTIYTYKCGKVEYVVAPLGNGDYELSLSSSDPIPANLKQYCDCCGREK